MGRYRKGHQGAQGKIIEQPHEDAPQEPEKSKTGIKKAETGGPAVAQQFRDFSLDWGYISGQSHVKITLKELSADRHGPMPL